MVDVQGKVKRYNPLRTLFPPRYLSVYGAITDTGALGGLVTGGEDSLSQHLWSASVHYRTDSRYFGGSGGYTLAAFHPRVSIYFSSIALDYGRMLLRNDSVPPPGGTPSCWCVPHRRALLRAARSTQRWCLCAHRASAQPLRPLQA